MIDLLRTKKEMVIEMNRATNRLFIHGLLKSIKLLVERIQGRSILEKKLYITIINMHFNHQSDSKFKMKNTV